MEHCIEYFGLNKQIPLKGIDSLLSLAHCTENELLASLFVFLYGSKCMPLDSHRHSLLRCLRTRWRGTEAKRLVSQYCHTRRNREGHSRYESKGVSRSLSTRHETC